MRAGLRRVWVTGFLFHAITGYYRTRVPIWSIVRPDAGEALEAGPAAALIMRLAQSTLRTIATTRAADLGPRLQYLDRGVVVTTALPCAWLGSACTVRTR